MKAKHFLIILAAGILAALILFTCNCHTIKQPKVISIKTQIEKVIQNEAKYKVNSDSLILVISKITADRKDLSCKLKTAQEENKRRGEILLRQAAAAIPGTIEQHDDTEQAAKDLVESSALSDSLCNKTISNLESQITQVAKLAAMKDTLYFQLRQSFNTAIDQQQALTTYNKQLLKQIRHKKIQSFFWKAAAVGAGVFILKTAIK